MYLPMFYGFHSVFKAAGILVLAGLLCPLQVSAAEEAEGREPTLADTIAASKGIKWAESYGKAREKVQQDESLMMVLLTREEGCPYCIKLKDETLSDARVVSALAEIPSVRLTPDDAEYQVVGRKLGAQGVPFTAFLDDDGGVVHRINGFVPPERYLQEVETAVEQRSLHKETLKAYLADKSDLLAGVSLIESYLSRDQSDQAKELISELKPKVYGEEGETGEDKPEQKEIKARLALAEGMLALSGENDDLTSAFSSFEAAEKLAADINKEVAAQALFITGVLHFQLARGGHQTAGGPSPVERLNKAVQTLEECSRKYPETKFGQRSNMAARSIKAAMEQARQQAGGQ